MGQIMWWGREGALGLGNPLAGLEAGMEGNECGTISRRWGKELPILRSFVHPENKYKVYLLGEGRLCRILKSCKIYDSESLFWGPS